MNVFLNEMPIMVSEDISAFQIKERYKPEADIVIVNSHVILKDISLKDSDRVALIKKGEMPSKEELESLLVARHTAGVHEKVKQACVGIAGLGGLGSNVAISLTRLGVGKMILVDHDVVEPSNLNRQQYYVKHIGMKKTEALKSMLEEINPFVEVCILDVFVDESNIESCFKDADIMVEAFDGCESKSELVNSWAQLFPKKPIIAASGMAGYFSNNTIRTKHLMGNIYLVGDDVAEARPGCGLMAPRVAIAANHQANTVLRLIMGEKNTE